MIGESLGPYKILEPLGAGGMGAVYLGEDTRLGRKVAIKVLPAEFASDPERLARFEQEARAAAALNHPHIAVVHDVGSEATEDGTTTHFMVQEYLEGQSLRERLDKGALPLDKALDLAIEVGEALIAAHRAGIIHRDLKPDNVFLTEEGHAKVLDFGLAKLTEVAAPAGSSASMSPTMLGTVAGHVMGTAGYMAPEQVNGEEVDQRADLFAFGAVLYEAVTGNRAFLGESIPDTLSRILHYEPEPLASSGAATPAELGRIVSKCLAKDPARRYQGAADLTVDLRALAANSGADQATTIGKSHGHSPRPVEARRSVPLRLALIAGLVLVAGTALVMQALRPSSAPPTAAEVTIVVPDDMSFDWMSHRFLAVAPDGGAVVFSAGDLRLRRLGDREPTSLPGTAGARSPFFSPDGTQVGFFRGGLWRVAVDGGGPVLVTEEPGVPAGASWSADDTIYFGSVGGVWSVPAAGGDPELVVPVEGAESVFGPQLLPDQWLLYSSREGNEDWDSASIVAFNLSTNERKLLVDEAMAATYVDSGHLLYVRDLELYAVPLDTHRMELDGAPAVVVSGVSVAQWGAAQYDVSRSGTLAYYGRSSDWNARLVLLDEDGDFLRAISSDLHRPRYPAVSPDGTRVVVQTDGALWIHHLDGRPPIRLPTVGATQAIWAPDGSEIVFEDGQGQMARVAADASGRPPQIIMATHHHPLGWTTDGRLMFSEISPVGSTSLFSMPIDDPSAATDLLVRETNDGNRAAVSPNGRWLAFTSNSTGEQEIWIMEIPGGSPLRISSGGADHPVWSPAGDELFYASGDAIMVVGSDDADSFEPGPPRQLFVPPRTTLGVQAPNFDVTEDGSFVILELTEADQVRGRLIEVSINWFEELKELVPTER